MINKFLRLVCVSLILTCIFSIKSFSQSSQWEVYTTANSSLPEDTVYSIACDNMRSAVWIGTSEYVAELKGSNWTVFDPNNYNENNPYGADAIVITPDDSVWVGGGLGQESIDEFNGTSWSSYNTNVLLKGDITSMVYDRSKQILWIGTGSVGLMGFDLSSKTWGQWDYSDNGALNYDSFRTLALDSTGSLWLSDGAGMEKFTYHQGNPSTWTDTLVYQQFDGTSSLPQITNPALPTDGPLAITVDGSNTLWLGTRQKGIMKYDGNLVTQYSSNTISGFMNDHVHSILMDKCGDIWAGTSGGAAEYDGSTWQWLTTSNSSLPNDTVLSMAVDAMGHLWFGTKGGFAEYKPLPHSATLSLPPDGVVVNGDSALCMWQASCPGVLKYWFEIADNSSFTNSTIDSSLTNTSKMASNLNNSTTYYWRVKAGNDAGWGPFSSTFKFTTSNTTGISDNNKLPKEFNLYQNYPNPFNPSTMISYSIPKSSFVSLKIYNTLGQEVANLVNKEQQPGNYSFSFNASALPSGVYFYKLNAGSFSNTKKFILLR